MQCPQCQFDNPAQMKFCGQCGTRLQLLCASCGAELPPGFRFCGQCGVPLQPAAALPQTPPVPAMAPTPGAPEPPFGSGYAPTAPGPGNFPTAPTGPSWTPGSAPETISTRPHSPQQPQIFAEAGRPVDRHPGPAPAQSEIKQVSVLSAELQTRSKQGKALSAESLHALLGRFFELARAEVERFGGTLKPPSGSSLQALFGAPIAHEDHSRRAALAAVALRQRLVHELAQNDFFADVQGQLHIGLDTGSVVVGGLGDVAVGEATERASRLQEMALADEILASDRMRDALREEFDFSAAESESGDLQAFRIEEQKSAEQDLSRWHGGRLTPFVGRQREMAQLEELVSQVNARRGQVVGLIGDAGSGKSRLLYEFRRRRKSTVYLRGRCLSYGSAIPYAPLIDMVRRASRIQDSDPASIAVAKLRQSLDTVGVSTSELPYFLRLLGIREGADATDHLEPLALQNQTFKAMRRMVLNASQHALVVMELEDLHWLDETSQSFLVSLVEAITAARVLLIFTWRTGYQPPWTEKSYSSQISLQRLSESDSEMILNSILKQNQDLGENAGEVLRKAEGNPLFLEELARALREQDGSGEAIPNTIQGILMARIDRLPQEHKRMLQVASVLGREFPLPLLETLWQFEGSTQSGTTPLASVLDDLQRWEWIYASPTDNQHPIYVFKHALIQDVSYQSLLAQRRESLHLQAARSLEERYAERLEEAYDRLIYHYPKANEPEKTVYYLRRFAERAARNNTHAEAAQALRQALEHATSLNSAQTTIEILLELAASLLPLAAFPETLERLTEYRDTLAQCEDPSLKGRYHFWLAHTSTYLGDQDATRENAQLAIEAAREAGDEATEGQACYVLGRDGFWSGRFQAGIENSLQAVVLLERAGEPWWQGQAYWVAGFNHYVLGEFDEALDALQRAFDIGEALDDHRLDTSWSIGYAHASLGDAEQGIEFCERGLAHSQDPLNSAVATGFLGYALIQAGRLDEAIETLNRAIESLKPTGMLQILGWFAAFLAEAHLAAHHPEPAEEAARQGVEWCQKSRFLYGEALALSCLRRLQPEDSETSSRLHQLLDDLGLAPELTQRL